MFDLRSCVQCNKADIFGCCTMQSRNREILTNTAITFDSSHPKRPDQVADFANHVFMTSTKSIGEASCTFNSR
jgi:hypothetical protein